MEMTLQEFLNENYVQQDLIAFMNINEKKEVNTYCYHPNYLLQQENKINSYMSLNTLQFVNGKIRRNQEHVRRLKFLYADLDTYHTGYTNDQILMNLEENFFNQSIPVPSYVISSGRGMYLLWRIDEHIKALPRWKKIQEYLYSQLKEFGADSCVTTDYARVFRMVGSRNSKSGRKVEIIYNYKKKYTLYEIQEEYVPQNTSVLRFQNQKGRFIPFDSTKKLFTDRLRDLKTLLLKHRDSDGAYRENILFLYRYYHLCMYRDKTAALKATMKLNNQLKYSLSEKEVIAATKSAEKYFNEGCSFGITNAKLVKFLNITDTEVLDMPSIPTKETLKERKSKYNHRTYINRLKRAGNKPKEQLIKERVRNIYFLIKKGKNQKDICTSLGISRATYYADLQIVKKMMQAIKKTNEVPNEQDTLYSKFNELSNEENYEYVEGDTRILQIENIRPPIHLKQKNKLIL